MATAPIFLKVNSNSLRGEPDGLMLRPCCENVSFYHLCILSPPPNLFQIHRTKYPLFFFHSLLMICLLNYGGLHSCYVKLPVFTVSGSYSEKM